LSLCAHRFDDTSNSRERRLRYLRQLARDGQGTRRLSQKFADVSTLKLLPFLRTEGARGY